MGRTGGGGGAIETEPHQGTHPGETREITKTISPLSSLHVWPYQLNFLDLTSYITNLLATLYHFALVGDPFPLIFHRVQYAVCYAVCCKHCPAIAHGMPWDAQEVAQSLRRSSSCGGGCHIDSCQRLFLPGTTGVLPHLLKAHEMEDS